MKLDVVEIQVKDFKKSVEWYKNLLKLLHVEKDFAMFNSGKATLALYKGKKNCINLYFRSKDLEKSYALMKKKGVNISRIIKVHWGRKFYFKDPEGNKHFIYEEHH